MPAALVFVICGTAVMQEYMRQRVAMQQFLVGLALERSQREHAIAEERRRVVLEASDRFERSFGYICKCAAAASAACVLSMKYKYKYKYKIYL
jgi:hypothetical protein